MGVQPGLMKVVKVMLKNCTLPRGHYITNPNKALLREKPHTFSLFDSPKNG